MRILLLHNYYQLQGGEDLTFEAEANMLSAHGHEVVRFSVRSDDVGHRGNLSLVAEAVWNRRVYADLEHVAAKAKPEVAHFHNTFPRLSPAALYAARRSGAAVVATVQNYRLLCANALLFRSGRVCEECVGYRAPWRAVLHGCYRASRGASAAVTGMLALHRLAGTWDRAVDVIVTPSDFTRRRLASLGLRRAALRTKVNFLDPDPGAGKGGGNYALFVGRLSPEKGLEPLMSAWRRLGGEPSLRVVGTGPLEAQLARNPVPGVEFLGQRDHAGVISLIADASCLIVPSLWFEGLPRVVVEAYACGTPVLASRVGALEEAIHEGRTGELFRPGDPDDLARAVRSILGRPDRLAGMRLESRREFEQKYTADRNHEELMGIYELAKGMRVAGR